MRNNVLFVSKINRSTFISRSFLAAKCKPAPFHLLSFPVVAVGGFVGPDKVPHSFSLTLRPSRSAITCSGWKSLLQFCQRITDPPPESPDLINVLSSGSYKFPNDVEEFESPPEVADCRRATETLLLELRHISIVKYLLNVGWFREELMTLIVDRCKLTSRFKVMYVKHKIRGIRERGALYLTHVIAIY